MAPYSDAPVTALTAFVTDVRERTAQFVEDKLAPSTRALYERNMEKLVLPAFEHYLRPSALIRE